MKILHLTTAALAAATAIGVSGAAIAGPASNLATDQQTAQRDDKGAVQEAQYYGYYYEPYYYRPYYRHYRPYYYRPYYRPYYYEPYYGYPSFNFGIHIR